MGGPAGLMDAQHCCSCSPTCGISCTSYGPASHRPELPALPGGSPSPTSCSCPSPRHRRGPGAQPIPTWPQQLPQQLGSGISSLATLHSAPGPLLQECHSRGHKGPLCEQSRGVGAQPSISGWGWGEPQLRSPGWAAADSSMAPARHGGLPTTARDIREESPLLILLVPPAPAASCGPCWLRKQHQHQ